VSGVLCEAIDYEMFIERCKNATNATDVKSWILLTSIEMKNP